MRRFSATEHTPARPSAVPLALLALDAGEQRFYDLIAPFEPSSEQIDRLELCRGLYDALSYWRRSLTSGAAVPDISVDFPVVCCLYCLHPLDVWNFSVSGVALFILIGLCPDCSSRFPIRFDLLG